MQLATLNPYEPPIVVYVFGQDNYRNAIDMGFKDVRIIDPRPTVWDMKKHPFRHKIEIWHRALQDFDEIVFLDWDCLPVSKIPENFWETMSNGPNMQGTLYCYYKRKCFWRKVAQRTVIAATFLYLRGNKIGKELIELWEASDKPWSEEVLLMNYWDNQNGGWKGAEYYLENGFEPIYHTLYAYNKEILKSRQMVFLHCGYNNIKKFRKGKTQDGIKKKLDAFCKQRSEKLIISNG